MSDNHNPKEFSIEELEQLLYLKKRAQRRKRLQRLKSEGRLVEFNQCPTLDETSSPAEIATDPESSQLPLSWEEVQDEELEDAPDEAAVRRGPLINWRWVSNKVLLVIEIVAVLSLILIVLSLWQTTQNLNDELAKIQAAQSQSVALPTLTPTPVIGVAVLPSGHKPPVNGRPPEPGEAGDIPAHLLPIIDSYVPPPIPTPGPEQARRIEIPAINVDKPIVQGDDWEQLKKGAGQHVGSSPPGKEGNLVLSAHNDIYGEIFRNLDKLSAGDEIIISTERQSYVYIVNDIQVVEPTDVWVMAPTEHASATLISCYPYLVNNKRIVISADLAYTNLQSRSSS
ncbi:MAG: hypothetical protein BMS9Abin02_0627 [Anaerolineae bacterium]|nr:MAG: hypothetical protein BMS9Abin02_0627 [Anaerolineae bacterium]